MNVESPAPSFKGGTKVRVTNDTSHLRGKVLIVMAPSHYWQGSRLAVQCFEPETGYVWPFKADELEKA